MLVGPSRRAGVRGDDRDEAHLVNVAEDGLLDGVVLDDLTEDTAVTATNNKNLLGVGVRVHGQVSDHLLVRELITLGALDDVVENQNHAVVGGLEDENILVLGLLVVDDLLDLEGHGLAWGKSSTREKKPTMLE